ncbi:ATPase [Microvirga sp. 2TAF3]|uniref:ATPase n=1 Tax=Microvirga sp. 2TAF3 TaxID=3233014 RepID=UPI003F9E8DC2
MRNLPAHFVALGSWFRERDERRGYAISYKRLALAYLAETVIIVASLCGAWLFAHIYGHNDPSTIGMMMLAPIGYAVIEFCRVPLAVSTRTHRSYIVKTLAVVGVIAAAGVTIKSMSQLGEVMFRPRLVDVVRAHAALAEARDERASLDAKMAAADKIVAEQEDARKGAEKRAMDATAQLSSLPPQKCWVVSGRDRRGNPYRTTKCSTDPRTGTIGQTLKEANANIDEVTAKLDAARTERAKYDRASADRKVIAAEVTHKEAVLNSQLHSFTAMAFAKDPTQVTDAEIHEFLRIFVFVPAIFVSLASTLLALTAVEKTKPKAEPVLLADEAGQYILGPYATEIIREATDAATQAAHEAVEKARHPPLKAVV